MDVTLPNGVVVRGVPEGTTKEQVAQKAIQAGLATAEDFSMAVAKDPDTFGENVVDVAAEGAAGFNRTVADLVDFIGPDTLNAILRLGGSDKQVPTLRESLPGIEGGFMEPGLAREAVRAGGEVAPAALGVGQIARTVASKLPMATAGETTATGLIREMGRTTPLQDAGYGVAAGIGGEVGEEIAGEPGKLVGSVVAPVAGSIGYSAAIKKPLQSTAAKMAKVLDDFQVAGATPTVGQVSDNKFVQGMETLMSKYLGGGPINKAIESTTKSVQKTLQTMADDITPVRGAEAAGRKIQEGISGKGGFVDRFKAKSGNLWRAVDEKIGESTVKVTNSKATLDDLVSDGAFAKILNEPKMAAIKQVFDDVGDDVAYAELKKLRSIVGRKIANKDLISDMPRAELKQLYGAISRDIEQAARGKDAISAYTRANTYTRSGHRRLDDFVERVAKKVDLDKIYDSVTKGGEGAAVINSFKRSLKPDEWEAVVGNVIRRLGRATSGNQDDLGEVFSLPRLLTQWDKMGPAKKALFSGTDKLNSYGNDLNSISSIANTVKQDLRQMANPSGSGQYIANVGTAIAGAVAVGTGNIPTATALLAGVALNSRASALMASPRFVHWLAMTSKSTAKQFPAAIAQLANIARGESDEVTEGIDELLTTLKETAESESEQ